MKSKIAARIFGWCLVATLAVGTVGAILNMPKVYELSDVGMVVFLVLWLLS